MTLRYISCTTSDRPYDGMNFINFDGKGGNNDAYFCYGHFNNFPIHQIHSCQWLDILPKQDIKLILYWQQSPFFCDFSPLPTEVCDRIRNDPNVYLLCVDALETILFTDKYTQQCIKYNVPANKTIVLTSNHEINNRCVDGINYLSIEYWESMTRHHYRWMSSANMVTMNQREADIHTASKKFISLNRNLKVSRMAWKYAMSLTGLQSQGHVSYHLPSVTAFGTTNHETMVYNQLSGWFPDIEKSQVEHVVSKHLRLLELDDLSNHHHPVSYTGDIINYYRDSLVSFVTESHHNTVFLTEKTFKAIAMGHPYFIIGTPENHARMREKGYYTFERLFGCQQIINVADMVSACELMRQRSITDLRQEILTEWMPKIRHNFELFFNSQTDWTSIENRIKSKIIK